MRFQILKTSRESGHWAQSGITFLHHLLLVFRSWTEKRKLLSNGMRDAFPGPRHGEGRHMYAGFCGYELPIQGPNYELPQGLK